MSLEQIKERCVEIGDCWEWSSPDISLKRKRNPEMRVDGKVTAVRRYAYGLAKNPAKGRLVVTPSCGNPYCLNPDHQKAVTHQRAMQDASKRGSLKGITAKKLAACRANAKISEEIAREIRSSHEPGHVLGAKYGIHKSMVNRIKQGKNWRDTSNPFAGLFAMNDSMKRAA
jgi:hypothetical protein